jgi:hypothetical protein
LSGRGLGSGVLGGAVGGGGGYEEVIRSAERLFNRLRYAVAQSSAPTTLKSSFLDPVASRLAHEVAVDLFARTDEQFMAMFAGEGGGRSGERLQGCRLLEGDRA